MANRALSPLVPIGCRVAARRRALPRLAGRVWLMCLLAAGLVCAPCTVCPAQTVHEQETWEYSPYRIRVLLAVEPAAELTPSLRDEILETIASRARVSAGVTWRLQVEPAPTALAPSLVAAGSRLTVDQIEPLISDVWSGDKVMLMSVGRGPDGYWVFARELDCATRTLGQVVRLDGCHITRLPHDAVDALLMAFAPLVRVEESRGGRATVRVRAGGLVIGDDSPSRVKPGDVLRPIIRRNDRRGEPRPDGIQEVDWTYLLVREQEEYLLHCDVFSAMRNPLAGRTSPTIERMALKVKPAGDVTRIRLLARGPAAEPLEGYEIFVKQPTAMGDEDAKKLPERLGSTDWRGSIDVPAGEVPLRLVYVKNGSFLLARLPVVPGFQAEQTVELPSDDKRLETEAFVRGMESTVMDVVARREILAARIRRRIGDGKIDEARKILEEFKSLPTREDLEQIIAGRQQSRWASTDEREQQRIDQMLNGTRLLLHKYLGPDQLVTLQREVDRASAKDPADSSS